MFVIDLIAKFSQSKFCANVKHNKPIVLNEAPRSEVLCHSEINANTSLCGNIVAASGISFYSLNKTTKLHKCVYKV